MGTKPSLWTPTGISGESINTWSAMTQPLSAVKANLVLVEGMPSENPNNGHGASDSLTGQGFGYYGQGVIKISVDQFIAKKLVAAGINRPISSLLLGANTSDNGGISQFYGGATGGNLPTIGSPLSAYNTVFGAALPPGMSASALLARRKSILDLVKAETTTLKGSLGNNEKAKLDVHLDSIRQLENKLNATMPAGNACTKPNAPGADSAMQYMGSLDGCAANVVHQNIIASAFACDITRVACLEYGNDQTFKVNAPGLPFDDQHGGFIHSGASSNFANLVKFEAYLATQFVNIINLLKGFAGSGRRVEDAVRHDAAGVGARHGRLRSAQPAVDAFRARERQRRLPQGRGRRPLHQVDRTPRAHPAQHLRGDGRSPATPASAIRS